MDDDKRLAIALLIMRIGVFVVMIMWSIDKIVNPGHAAAVFEGFYFIPGMGAGLLTAIAIVQIILELAFLAGLFKTITYGYVLIVHAVSTLSSWRQYLDPLDNMLFLAAIPMLAACIALFMLRDRDRLLSAG